MKTATIYAVRISENIQADIARNWSAWNSGFDLSLITNQTDADSVYRCLLAAWNCGCSQSEFLQTIENENEAVYKTVRNCLDDIKSYNFPDVCLGFAQNHAGDFVSIHHEGISAYLLDEIDEDVWIDDDSEAIECFQNSSSIPFQKFENGDYGYAVNNIRVVKSIVVNGQQLHLLAVEQYEEEVKLDSWFCNWE